MKALWLADVTDDPRETVADWMVSIVYALVDRISLGKTGESQNLQEEWVGIG